MDDDTVELSNVGEKRDELLEGIHILMAYPSSVLATIFFFTCYEFFVHRGKLSQGDVIAPRCK